MLTVRVAAGFERRGRGNNALLGLGRDGRSGGCEWCVETDLRENWGRKGSRMKRETRWLMWLQGRPDFGIDWGDVDGRTRSPSTELMMTTTTEKVVAKCDYHQNHESRYCYNDADQQGD